MTTKRVLANALLIDDHFKMAGRMYRITTVFTVNDSTFIEAHDIVSGRRFGHVSLNVDSLQMFKIYTQA